MNPGKRLNNESAHVKPRGELAPAVFVRKKLGDICGLPWVNQENSEEHIPIEEVQNKLDVTSLVFVLQTDANSVADWCKLCWCR